MRCKKIAFLPERFRPVEGKMYDRKAIIDFGYSGYSGYSGYIARFRHMPGGDITIARINHQREDEFQP